MNKLLFLTTLIAMSASVNAQSKSIWQQIHEEAMRLHDQRGQIEQQERDANNARYSGVGQSACRDIPSDIQDAGVRQLYKDYIDGFVSGWNLESSALNTSPWGLAGSGVDDIFSLVMSKNFMDNYCSSYFGSGLADFIYHIKSGRGSGISIRGLGLNRCAQFSQDISIPMNRNRYEQWSIGFLDGSNSLAINLNKGTISMPGSPFQVLERDCFRGNPASSVAVVLIRFTDATKRRESSIR